MVDEMQWAGDNAAEMRAWAGTFLEPRHGWPAMVPHQDPNDGTMGWLEVQVGDIVTRTEPEQRFKTFGRDPYPSRCKPLFTVRRPCGCGSAAIRPGEELCRDCRNEWAEYAQ